MVKMRLKLNLAFVFFQIFSLMVEIYGESIFILSVCSRVGPNNKKNKFHI